MREILVTFDHSPVESTPKRMKFVVGPEACFKLTADSQKSQPKKKGGQVDVFGTTYFSSKFTHPK